MNRSLTDLLSYSANTMGAAENDIERLEVIFDLQMETKRLIKERAELMQQKLDMQVKHEVACASLEAVKAERDVARRALNELREAIANTQRPCGACGEGIATELRTSVCNTCGAETANAVQLQANLRDRKSAQNSLGGSRNHISNDDTLVQGSAASQDADFFAGLRKEAARRERDQAVTPEYASWLDEQAKQGIEAHGGNEIWNAATKAALLSPTRRITDLETELRKANERESKDYNELLNVHNQLKLDYEKLRRQFSTACSAGIELAAKWVDARREAFITKHGVKEPLTMPVDYGIGKQADLKHEYEAELTGIAEGIRALPDYISSSEEAPVEVWAASGMPVRHKRTGGLYVVQCLAQSKSQILDKWEEVVIYKSTNDDRVFVRDVGPFSVNFEPVTHTVEGESK